MHAVTQALFYTIPDEIGFRLDDALACLVAHGVSPTKIGPSYTFDYFDEHDLGVCITTTDQRYVFGIQLSVRLPGDSAGWSGWSKEAEMTRLEIQERWLASRSLVHKRVSNLFSPQDGCSAIYIENRK